MIVFSGCWLRIIRKRRKISSNISCFVFSILGNFLPASLAEMTMAALCSETQKRDAGDLATSSNIRRGVVAGAD